jgi:uncharacterized membrane protein
MLEKIGIAALVILVASESFAFSEAVLWALAAVMHLGEAVQKGTFAVAALLGVAAGWWIWQSALAHRE